MWRIGIAFLAGHCLIHTLSVLPQPQAWAWILAGAVVIALCMRSPLLLVLCLGVAWAWMNAGVRLMHELSPELEGQDLLVSGYVASLPDQRNTDPQFTFDVTPARDDVPRRIRLSLYDTEFRPQPGEHWRLVVRLKRRTGFANPGGFDYEGHLFRDAIGATGYVREDVRNGRLAPASLWSAYGVLHARAWIAARIAAATHTPGMLGILQGLAVGETQAMSPDQWRVLAATGTTHLMAISGLHISMLSAVAAWLGGRVVWLRRAQRWRLSAVQGQAIAGVLAAVGYSLLAGLSVPTQRTMVMLCVYFVVRARRREMNVGHAFGWALIGVLVIDPFAPLAVGAWLSFGAVAVILLTISGRLRADGAATGFARVQWAVTVGLVPLLIAAFGSVSLVSPLANAAAVPFFTLLVVPLVLLGALLAAFSLSAGGLVLGLVAQLLEHCWPVLEWFASWPLALWYFPRIEVAASVALAAGTLLLTLPGIWPIRLVAAALCMPALTHRPAQPAPGAFELAVLDVGQGLAVVVRTHSHALVYDTGPAFRTGRDTGELVVLPFLRHRGVRRIDLLVVSHADLDHRGGVGSLLRGMPTRRVLVGPSVDRSRVEAELCRRGRRWQWDGVIFDVLHPAGEAGGENDSSCVLRIHGAGGSALLTGDIEQEGESALLATALPATDIVVVPHHGSGTSSSPAFVRAVRARIAVFSAGYRNRWDFPKSAIVERWRAAGARTFSTIDGGAIELSIADDGIRPVREHRRRAARYWHTR